ncbi:hypothetical protein [Candidatus Protochlamydia amoebophila]|uniref:hypothetical protein n=1 Tax=Candidatus Protochlamydia amoebophila TaxID=362787 RepID=UPI001BC9B666|nr:hypothetical protein [Candidatus Protochlamydia amoebophila]
MKHVGKTKVNFEVPIAIHNSLKKCAIELGMSFKELATQAFIEKLEMLEYEQDCKDAEAAHDRFIKNGSKTISHEEMMKKIGWDEL